MNTTLVLAIALVVVIVAIGAAFYVERRRSHRMRARYGAEYLATVDELGDRRKAEAELKRREKRVDRFDIRPLTAAETDRFIDRWVKVQADFVDDPGVAISRADDLLGEVMHARGYPVSDFAQRADDLSVDHPKVVTDYRIAHEVALRHARGDAGTEDLRRAMLHYRELFAELVDVPPPSRRPQETRTFKEEPQDERAARARDAGYEPDDASPRERGLRPDAGRGPVV